MTLGKKLAVCRREFGITQQQLGDLLAVSAQAVSKWENDQAEPDLQTLRRLCIIYKIKMDDLFGDESAAVPAAEKPFTEGAGASYVPAAAPVPSAAMAQAAPAPQAEPKLIGYCTQCGCAVYKGNEKRLSSGLYCTTCYGKKLRSAREMMQKAQAYEAQTAQAQPLPKPAKPVNGFGIAGLVLSILTWVFGCTMGLVGLFVALIALGCSIRGMVRRYECSAPGVSVAALVISIIGLVATVIYMILFGWLGFLTVFLLL